MQKFTKPTDEKAAIKVIYLLAEDGAGIIHDAYTTHTAAIDAMKRIEEETQMKCYKILATSLFIDSKTLQQFKNL